MKLILTLALLFNIATSFGQHELDKAESCEIDIFKTIGEVYLAYGSSECVYFKISSLPDNFTLLVFNASNKTDLIYKSTFIAGQRQGSEIIIINNEKVITTYINGQKEGKSFTFYENGNIHFERVFKNDKLVGKINEYNKEGRLIKKFKPNKK